MKIVALTTAILFTGSASAATIIWGTAANLTNDNGVSDVSTNGTLVEAINAGAAPSNLTINTVTFTPSSSTGVGAMSNNDASNNNSLLTAGSSPEYRALMAYNKRNTSNSYYSATLADGLLISGQQYEIQVWFAAASRNDLYVGRFDSGVSTASVDLLEDGQYVTGTFTADGTSQILRIGTFRRDPQVITQPQINAYQIRLLSPVPEPSSTALIGLGGLALILRRRR